MTVLGYRVRLLSLGLGMGLIGAFHTAPARADFVTTGGTLTNVTVGTIAADASSFDATHTTFVSLPPPGTTVTDTTVSGTFGSQLSIDADAQTVYSVGGPLLAIGHATGTIGLDVTAPETVSFSWSNNTATPYGELPEGTLTLENAGGAAVLGCIASGGLVSPNPGGCALGTSFSAPGTITPPGLLSSGTLNLAPGDYTLLIAISSDHGPGVPYDTGYRFDMAPAVTPLPPAALLLLSGLAGLRALTALGGKARGALVP